MIKIEKNTAIVFESYNFIKIRIQCMIVENQKTLRRITLQHFINIASRSISVKKYANSVLKVYYVVVHMVRNVPVGVVKIFCVMVEFDEYGFICSNIDRYMFSPRCKILNNNVMPDLGWFLMHPFYFDSAYTNKYRSQTSKAELCWIENVALMRGRGQILKK